MPRKLNAWELNALDEALKNGTTREQIDETYGVDKVDATLAETGLRLPDATASKISEYERNLYITTLASGQDLWSNITSAGVTSSAALQRLNEAQLYVPLVREQQEVYDWASENKISATELAELAGVDSKIINTNLEGAGLSLLGGIKKGTKTGGGMYGFAPGAETPKNVMGQIPQLPQLRQIRRTAKRQNDPNWKGTTDTILTSGRGVNEAANTSVKTLLGS